MRLEPRDLERTGLDSSRDSYIYTHIYTCIYKCIKTLRLLVGMRIMGYFSSSGSLSNRFESKPTPSFSHEHHVRSHVDGEKNRVLSHPWMVTIHMWKVQGNRVHTHVEAS